MKKQSMDMWGGPFRFRNAENNEEGVLYVPFERGSFPVYDKNGRCIGVGREARVFEDADKRDKYEVYLLLRLKSFGREEKGGDAQEQTRTCPEGSL